MLIATKTTLFCWDFEKNNTFSVSAPKTSLIKIADCRNSKSSLTAFGNQDCFFVFVALESGEIRLYNLYLGLQKFELNKVLLNDDQKIFSFAHLRKNGRVFYGGS